MQQDGYYGHVLLHQAVRPGMRHAADACMKLNEVNLVTDAGQTVIFTGLDLGPVRLSQLFDHQKHHASTNGHANGGTTADAAEKIHVEVSAGGTCQLLLRCQGASPLNTIVSLPHK